MHVELTPAQRTLMLQLLDTALREIGPEIRHSDSREYRDDLKERRRDLHKLQDVLTGSLPAIVPSPAEESTSNGLSGTP